MRARKVSPAKHLSCLSLNYASWKLSVIVVGDSLLWVMEALICCPSMLSGEVCWRADVWDDVESMLSLVWALTSIPCCSSTLSPTVLPGETWTVSSMTTLLWGESKTEMPSWFLLNPTGEEVGLEEWVDPVAVNYCLHRWCWKWGVVF